MGPVAISRHRDGNRRDLRGPFRDRVWYPRLICHRCSRRRQLDCEISDCGAFHGAENHLETSTLSGEAIEQRVLISTADYEQPL